MPFLCAAHRNLTLNVSIEYETPDLWTKANRIHDDPSLKKEFCQIERTLIYQPTEVRKEYMHAGAVSVTAMQGTYGGKGKARRWVTPFKAECKADTAVGALIFFYRIEGSGNNIVLVTGIAP